MRFYEQEFYKPPFADDVDPNLDWILPYSLPESDVIYQTFERHFSGGRSQIEPRGDTHTDLWAVVGPRQQIRDFESKIKDAGLKPGMPVRSP